MTIANIYIIDHYDKNIQKHTLARGEKNNLTTTRYTPIMRVSNGCCQAEVKLEDKSRPANVFTEARPAPKKYQLCFEASDTWYHARSICNLSWNSHHPGTVAARITHPKCRASRCCQLAGALLSPADGSVHSHPAPSGRHAQRRGGARCAARKQRYILPRKRNTGRTGRSDYALYRRLRNKKVVQ